MNQPSAAVVARSGVPGASSGYKILAICNRRLRANPESSRSGKSTSVQDRQARSKVSRSLPVTGAFAAAAAVWAK